MTRRHMLESITDAYVLRSALKRHDIGLTLTQWAILARLSEAGRQRITDLAKHLHVKVPLITMMNRKLFEHGLIKYAPATSDKRENYVTLTLAGERALTRLESAELEAAA
jgi:DNA-binding MarR family transcriptional regulator